MYVQGGIQRWKCLIGFLKERRLLLILISCCNTLAVLQHEISLNPTDWSTVEHAITIPEVFNDITINISAEKIVSAIKS